MPHIKLFNRLLQAHLDTFVLKTSMRIHSLEFLANISQAPEPNQFANSRTFHHEDEVVFDWLRIDSILRDNNEGCRGNEIGGVHDIPGHGAVVELVGVLEVRLTGQEEAALLNSWALGDDVVETIVAHKAFGSAVVLVGDLDIFFRLLASFFGRLEMLAPGSFGRVDVL